MDFVYPDADKGGTADTTESSVAYLYASGRLSGINTATTSYTITYDTFGNMVSVSAGGNVLATYTYTAGNGKLTRMTYGNGEYEDYTYDNLDRLTKVTYNGSDENAFTVLYDSNGRLAKAVDGKVGITYLYEYDSLDRLIRAYQKDANGNTVYAVENSFDEYGRAKESEIVIGDKSHSYTINYKTNTNLVSSVSMPSAGVHSVLSYTYDDFDRVIQKHTSLSTLADIYEKYEYYTYTDADGTVRTTPLISKLTLENAHNYQTISSDVYEYTYNALGYISSVKKNGATIAYYSYDALGQLVTENNAETGQIYVYSYDKAGNITQKRVFTGDIGNLTDTINYTYSTSAWGDLLTNYDGTNISYDEIGNPTNWVGISSLTWDGRQLESINIDSYDTVEYKYNADGIRTQKQIYDSLMGGYVTHNYTLDGTKIIKEYVTNTGTGASHTLYYVYDANGNITGLHYQNTPYYFQKNIQGDILRICNSAGNVVVEYTYDAWGNILSVTGSMASTLGQYNPFRYRGYYYDSETELYYLQSRYYDPEVGRFINADRYASTGQGILGNNMFAYCGNNSVNHIDLYGDLYLDFSSLNSPNEIHNAVQLHIVTSPAGILMGMTKEVRAGDSILRIDLLDSNGGIYEVKPCTHHSEAGITAAYLQLYVYCQLSDYHMGTATFYGTFIHDKYTVTYWSEGAIIFYSFYENEQKKPSLAAPPITTEQESTALDKLKTKVKKAISTAEDYITAIPPETLIAAGAALVAVCFGMQAKLSHKPTI